MIERHQDYVLRGVTVAANATARFVVLMDVDAPFALRTLFGANSLSSFQFQILGYDDRLYSQGISNAAVDSLLNSPGCFFPFYPQITFPIQTSIQIIITDLSGVGSTNGVLVLRGTKLYPDGVTFGPKYPPKFSELNFRYPYKFTIPLGTVPAPSVLGSQPLNVKSDADFVFRMGSAFVQPGADAFDSAGTDCVLRDQYGKPYSSDSTGPGTPGWVPLALLFPVPGDSNRVCVPDVTVYPEIYVEKNSQLLLDLRRTSGAHTNTMNVVLHGSKIFPVTL